MSDEKLLKKITKQPDGTFLTEDNQIFISDKIEIPCEVKGDEGEQYWCRRGTEETKTSGTYFKLATDTDFNEEEKKYLDSQGKAYGDAYVNANGMTY